MNKTVRSNSKRAVISDFINRDGDRFIEHRFMYAILRISISLNH